MSDGTVRGTFDLNADPALGKLRSLKTEGGRADAMMRQLGGTMDRIGGPTANARLDSYKGRLRQVGTQAATTSATVTNSWDAQSRGVDRASGRIERRVDRLENRVQRYGRTRASATVDLNGFDKVNAQLTILERRLAALDRTRATPSVGVGGGFSNIAGGGASAAGGGGGGGGGGLGAAAKLALGGAALLPGAQGLLGGAAALVGSASGAALGAGAVGLGGVATLGVGAGLTATIVKPTLEGLKALDKEQAKYTATVERYGWASKQAAVAREALNRAEAKQPGGAEALRSVHNFTSGFRAATASGRTSIYGGIANVAAAGRVATPALARAANLDAGATATAASNFAGFLAGPQRLQGVTQLSREFALDLPIAERSLQNMTSTVEHLAVAARPFFHEGMMWVEHWTHGLASNTSNEARVQQTMRGLVSETKDWGRLAGATFRTVRDIFNMGRPAGDSMVVDLTTTLDRWDAWIQRNPTKVRAFFTEAKTTTEGIAGALTGIVHLLSEAAKALDPIFNRAMGLIRIVSALGPGVTTLGSAAAYGAFGGFRGGGGGGGSRAGSLLRTGVLGSPARFGGGTLVAGVAGGAAVSALSRASRAEVRRGVTSGGAFLMGPATVGPEAVLARRAAASEAALAGDRSLLSRGFGGLRSAGGAVASSRLGGALGGAAKTVGATVAIMAALESVGRGGSAGAMTQNFASSASMGLIHPVDNSGTRGAGWASRFAAGIPQTLSPTATQAVLGRKIARDLNRSFSERKGLGEANLGELIGQNRTNRYGGMHLNPNSPNFMAESGAALKRLEGTGGGHAANVVQEIKALRVAWQEAKAGADAYKKSHEAALDLQSEEHGHRLGSQLGGAFKLETGKGRSATGAFGDVTGGALSSMRQMREAGRKVLGENTLAWAAQLAKGNPAMAKPAQELTDRIKRMYHNLGQDIQIVNGHILTGSKSQWESISTAMSEPMEKAQEKMSKSFTAIANEAVGALHSMGYSLKSARAAVAGQEAGGRSALETVGTAATGGGIAGRKNNARGGMIGGKGLLDTVRVPGGMAAPGEAWIANRHTLRDLSAATVAMYGLTAEQMITSEHRAHSMGDGGGKYAMGGSLAGLRGGVQSVASAILGHFPGLSVSSTTGGRHATHSLHYLGEAVDLAGDPATMLRAAAWTGSNYGRSLAEGIHNPNLSIAAGRNVSPSYWGAATWAEHLNHIHVGVTGGGGASGPGVGAAGAGGGKARSLHLHGRRTGLGGVPGMLADRGSAIYAHSLQGRLNSHLASTAGALAGFHGGGGTSSANEALGRRMMIAAGWPSSEWPFLKALWTQESGWNANSVNSSSGAYGIPQCCPLRTRILTRDGWKAHDEVEVGDETIGYNPETGRSEWTPITAIHHPGKHPTRRFGTSWWSAESTDNHRWLMQRRDGSVALVELKERRSRDKVILAVPSDAGEGLSISLREAALLGWLAGEGWRIERKVTPRAAPDERGRRNRYRSMTYCLGQTKVEHWPAIDAAVGEHGRVSRTRNGHREWRLSAPYAQELIARAGDPKADAVALVLAMSPEQREVWLAAIIAAEGHTADGTTQISQAEGPLADAIVLAVYLSGKRPSVYRQDRTDDPRYKSVSLTITICDGHTGRPGHPGYIEEDAGEQEVWCVSTGLGSWTAEQDGNVFVTGNSLGHGHPFALGDAAGQIAWGLNYIRGRYGSPAGAEAHERAFNWYQRGGRTPSWGGWNAAGGTFETRGPTLFGAGEHGKRERVSITPAGSSNTGAGHRIEVNIHNPTFASHLDAEKVAHDVAQRILDELDAVGAAGVSDAELIGR